MPYKDPERRRAYGRAWMRANAEKARDAMRRMRSRDREHDRAKRRNDYARDPVRVRQANARYAKAHPEVRRTRYQSRRARVNAVSGSYTTGEWLALVAAHQGLCAYCGRQVPLTVEHRIPLSRGGTNSIDNIIPACLSCNSKKRQLTEEEFRRRLRGG